eukprot:PhM_4_TR9518/c2_g3_i1/m.98175/K00679/E2.3.1.158; phospholipid:diacylglycerol acyltransferase
MSSSEKAAAAAVVPRSPSTHTPRVRPLLRLLFLEAIPHKINTHRKLFMAICIILIAIIIRTTDVVPPGGNLSLDRVQEFLPVGLRTEEPFRPGKNETFTQTLGPHRRPVVIIPGFLSTALEVWEASTECAKDFQRRTSTSLFRTRLLSPQMLLLLVTDPMCYMQFVTLDSGFPVIDPFDQKVKVRSSMFGALSSADFVQQPYWVWAKVIRNLADMGGYDETTMFLAAFDWRLNSTILEARDQYFSRLLHQIELMTHLHPSQHDGSNKAVIMAHSYGSILAVKFFEFAERVRGLHWVNKHIDSFVNIGGPMLGIPKTLSALLSGEFRDTAELPSITKQILDAHIPKSVRAATFRSWPCLTEMLPRGPMARYYTNFTPFTLFKNRTLVESFLDVTTLIEMAAFRSQSYSLAYALSEEHVNVTDDAVFDFPKGVAAAGTLKVYCVYGVNKSTEIGYGYLDSDATEMLDGEGGILESMEGDGTVPLVSLGYHCRKRWPEQYNNNHKNPNSKTHKNIATIEIPHDTNNAFLDPRGGINTGDHVDILGNYDMIRLLMKIVSNDHDAKMEEDKIHSRIDDIVKWIEEQDSKKNK